MQVQVLLSIYGKHKITKTKQKRLYSQSHAILRIASNNKMLAMRSGIYAYRLIFDETRFSIGSAINLAQCFKQHIYKCSKYIGNNNKFYNAVKKYEWNNFQYGILENIILENKAIVNLEQNYLNKYSPSLNTSKKAGSMLGYKHSDMDKLKMGDLRRSKSYKWAFKPGSKRIVSEKTEITEITEKEKKIKKQLENLTYIIAAYIYVVD